MNNGCRCQECGTIYKVDVIVPDELWEKIKPFGKQSGSGLLCGCCIMRNLEELFDVDAGAAAFRLEPIAVAPHPSLSEGGLAR